MTLVKPTLKLIKQETPGEPDVYILKSSATFENENLESSGHGNIPTALNSEGDLDIELLITDSNNGNISGPSKVDHEVALGNLDFGVETFGIAVEIKNGGKTKGKGHIQNVDMVIFTKPDNLMV